MNIKIVQKGVYFMHEYWMYLFVTINGDILKMNKYFSSTYIVIYVCKCKIWLALIVILKIT